MASLLYEQMQGAALTPSALTHPSLEQLPPKESTERERRQHRPFRSPAGSHRDPAQPRRSSRGRLARVSRCQDVHEKENRSIRTAVLSLPGRGGACQPYLTGFTQSASSKSSAPRKGPSRPYRESPAFTPMDYKLNRVKLNNSTTG